MGRDKRATTEVKRLCRESPLPDVTDTVASLKFSCRSRSILPTQCYRGVTHTVAILVAELVRRQVSVIAVLETTNGALAAKTATQTIPIVFMQGANPIQIGLVDSLNRPGGNVTGIALLTAETAAKRLELLLELVPKATSIGYLRNPANRVYAESETREVEIAARAHGVRLVTVNASRLSEIETAFAEHHLHLAGIIPHVCSDDASRPRYSRHFTHSFCLIRNEIYCKPCYRRIERTISERQFLSITNLKFRTRVGHLMPCKRNKAI